MLTNYDGTAITYDSIGNPTKWRNSSNLTWDGRTLTSQTLSNGNSITYKYNSDGIRTQKRVFDDVASAYITHDYVLDGSKILKETVTDNAYYNNYTLYYVYDADGSVTGLHYNNQPYYFQKNIQGDILRILDRTGTAVVEYTYDAWGNILSVTGSMASTLGQYNPFRYRGYYYDSETGLYYLNSRYYDAEVGRFINADAYASTGQGILGNNMFAYCLNNPAMYVDYNGLVATTPVHFSNGYNNATIDSTFETPWGRVTIQVDIVRTDLPEASATLGCTTIEYDKKSGITITPPNGVELEFELTSTDIVFSSLSSTLYNNDFVQIDTVFVENGVGLSFSIRNDNYELTGSITQEFYTPDNDLDNSDIVYSMLGGAALIATLKSVCSFVGNALIASAPVGSFSGYNIGNPLDGYIHAECFGIK